MARLAGVPSQVISRAKTVLEELEAADWQPGAVGAGRASSTDGGQVSLEDMSALALADKVLTPIEAMNLIYQWKKEL